MQAICSCFGVIFLVGMVAAAQAIHGRDGIALPPPPAVDASPVTDDYFGTKIVDNYRWLEDAKSPEAQAFIDAQNAYTERYLKQARIRSTITDDLYPLVNVTVTGIPVERSGSFFFVRRLADEQQSSIYVRHGSGPHWLCCRNPGSQPVGFGCAGELYRRVRTRVDWMRV